MVTTTWNGGMSSKMCVPPIEEREREREREGEGESVFVWLFHSIVVGAW